MVINSTTLTMTRMALSRTALRGMWALVSAVQVVQTTRPFFFLLSKSSQKLRGLEYNLSIHAHFEHAYVQIPGDNALEKR